MKLTNEQLETMARIARANPEVIDLARQWDGRHGKCPAGACRGSVQCDLYCNQVIAGRPVDVCPCELLGNDVTRDIKEQFFRYLSNISASPEGKDE